MLNLSSSFSQGYLRPTAAFDSIVEEVGLFSSAAGHNLSDCSLKLCRIESGLYLASPAGGQPARFLFEDRLHEFGVRGDTLVHVHLEAAEHDGDESIHISGRRCS